jgi:hypothetical protein
VSAPALQKSWFASRSGLRRQNPACQSEVCKSTGVERGAAHDSSGAARFLILHPKKVRYYLERRDPDFEAGLRRVLIVYQEVQLQNAKRAAGMVTSSKQELVDRIHLAFAIPSRLSI